MEAEGAIIAALNDVRTEFPAMRVRTEHVLLDGPLTVFRATITLPTGAEATGYGSVVGSGVEAIALAEGRALARTMALLGVDQDAYDGRIPGDDSYEDQGDDGSNDQYAGSGLYQAVADEPPSDPYNLGTSPSAAAVASATGMRLGVRPAASDRPTAAPRDEAAPAPDRPVARSRPASPPLRPVEAERPAPPRPEASAPASATGSVPDPATASPIQNDSDEDAGVSHQAFWRWAGERGLSNRTDVEDLIGQSIGGMRPAAVRDLVIAAQEGSEDDA